MRAKYQNGPHPNLQRARVNIRGGESEDRNKGEDGKKPVPSHILFSLGEGMQTKTVDFAPRDLPAPALRERGG